jgi:hypothetical protein
MSDPYERKTCELPGVKILIYRRSPKYFMTKI